MWNTEFDNKILSKRLLKEDQRITNVYIARDALKRSDQYAWHRQNVTYICFLKQSTWVHAFKLAGYQELWGVEILDIGCGTGDWLRMLADWGATPSHLHGVDLLEDRISLAKLRSPIEIDLQVNNGWPLPYKDQSVDLCAASTVFSSILDSEARLRLAEEMRRVIRLDGWIMIFDFAISDPRNSDTLGIGRREILRLFASFKLVQTYRLILAPPLLRRFPRNLLWLAHAMEIFFPFLCTHRLYVLQKQTNHS